MAAGAWEALTEGLDNEDLALLIHNGRSYDSKAILGVAYGYATGRPLGPHDFNGGMYGAAAVLRNLGFDVRNVREMPALGKSTRWPAVLASQA
jgi:hypothetical protein